MQTTPKTSIAVVGPEAMENLRLADALRGIADPQHVFRFLETDHLLAFLAEHAESPTVVFLDLFGYELDPITAVIGEVRQRFPKVVFSLYFDREVWRSRRTQLPGEWAVRLDHYYSLYKVPDDEEFEPIVRQAFRDAEWEAQYNFGHEPIRLTQPFDSGVLSPYPSPTPQQLGEETVFISYSRTDWEDAVSGLIEDLRRAGFQLWIDQGFLEGGDDWMDAIGAALKQCSSCLLVVSPEALQSRWVKMEYKYFLLNDKPIVPVMVKSVQELPWELSLIQYLDFTARTSPSHDQLHRALAQSAKNTGK